MAQPITTAEFDDVVASSATPVLVDFWATWCGPCRALGPTIEAISDEYAGTLAVYKCDVDANADLAERFGIVSIPTLILFKDGQKVLQLVGNQPKSTLVKQLEPYL